VSEAELNDSGILIPGNHLIYLSRYKIMFTLLAKIYKSYLFEKMSCKIQEDMIRLLAQSGYDLESWLISLYFNGVNEINISLDNCVWSNRKAWIGSHLPTNANPGDIWMDTVEMTPMILIPTPPEEVAEWSEELLNRLHNNTNLGWVSLRPVAGWQFSAFLELVTIESYDSQLLPPFPVMDTTRIIGDREICSNVVNITKREASIYALWFNKYTASPASWEYAYYFLGQDEFHSLWGSTRREWINDFIDETTSVICTPETVLFNVSDGLESEDTSLINLAKTLICDEWKFFDNVTFRTSVSSQIGLVNRWRSPLEIGNIQIPYCYSR
jgi:hypothetical protein